jgi:hypothetical protein
MSVGSSIDRSINPSIGRSLVHSLKSLWKMMNIEHYWKLTQNYWKLTKFDFIESHRSHFGGYVCPSVHPAIHHKNAAIFVSKRIFYPPHNGFMRGVFLWSVTSLLKVKVNHGQSQSWSIKVNQRQLRYVGPAIHLPVGPSVGPSLLPSIHLCYSC